MPCRQAGRGIADPRSISIQILRKQLRRDLFHLWRLTFAERDLREISNVPCFFTRNHRGNWSGRRGSNSQLSAWEAKLPLLYFHNLQNRLEKMNVHALHTVHVLPDLRVAAGRLGDGVPLLPHAFQVVIDLLTSFIAPPTGVQFIYAVYNSVEK